MVSHLRVGQPQRSLRLRRPRLYRLANSLFQDLRPGDLVYLNDPSFLSHLFSPRRASLRPFTVAYPTGLQLTGSLLVRHTYRTHVTQVRILPADLRAVRFASSPHLYWRAIHA